MAKRLFFKNYKGIFPQLQGKYAKTAWHVRKTVIVSIPRKWYNMTIANPEQ